MHQSTEEVPDEVMARLWPEVPAIADPQRQLYAAFGLQRASAWQLFRPRAFVQGLRALFKGHGMGSPRGADVMQMPGAFLFDDLRVVWQHSFRRGAGDQPDWRAVGRLVENAAGA